MGKLHTLRRAIEREPEKWARDWYYGARFDRGQWQPNRWKSRPYPYQAFIKSVLEDISLSKYTHLIRKGQTVCGFLITTCTYISKYIAKTNCPKCKETKAYKAGARYIYRYHISKALEFPLLPLLKEKEPNIEWSVNIEADELVMIVVEGTLLGKRYIRGYYITIEKVRKTLNNEFVVSIIDEFRNELKV